MKDDDFYENDFDNDCQDYDDYSDEGCGEGFSCSECNNFGCPAHPCN